jgi:hypothetical protein
MNPAPRGQALEDPAVVGLEAHPPHRTGQPEPPEVASRALQCRQERATREHGADFR